MKFRLVRILQFGILSTKKMVEYLIVNSPPENINLLLDIERLFAGLKRSITMNHFYDTKINGEKLLRKWLVLSASTKMLFC